VRWRGLIAGNITCLLEGDHALQQAVVDQLSSTVEQLNAAAAAAAKVSSTGASGSRRLLQSANGVSGAHISSFAVVSYWARC